MLNPTSTLYHYINSYVSLLLPLFIVVLVLTFVLLFLDSTKSCLLLSLLYFASSYLNSDSRSCSYRSAYSYSFCCFHAHSHSYLYSYPFHRP